MFIQKCFAQFTTSTANTIVTDIVADIGTVLASGLPVILGLIAILIGLFFVVRLITKKIGGSK
jgi:hypothetical protein